MKDYAGSFVYNGNTLEFMHTAEGRARVPPDVVWLGDCSQCATCL